jgi:hypothetical protein
MKIIADSWFVLAKDGNIIFGLLCALLLAAGIIFFSSRAFFAEYLTFSEYLSLSLAGVLFPLLLGVSLLTVLSFLFKFRMDFLFFPVLVLVCGFMAAVTWNKPGPKQGNLFPVLALMMILLVSIYVRLAFLSSLIVPPYFDSAQHNLIINNLIANYEALRTSTFDSIAGGYYHLGFHVLMAAFSLALHIPAKDAMLVFGQILLAFIPLPLFFFVRQETGSNPSAILAVLFAGWGWALPAHAINWGKYPALTGILAFEFTLSLVYLLLRSPKRHKWIFITVCLFCVCVSTFIHSRTLVLVGIAAVGALAAIVWLRLPKSIRSLIFLLTLGVLVTLALIIRSQPILSLVFDPYLQGGMWISLAVLFLSAFACREFPRAAFACILSLVLLLGSLLVPVINLVPGRAYQTLLDRPFAEMVLFFPLSFLAGLGFAGLVKTFNGHAFGKGLSPKWIPVALAFFLFGLIFTNAFSRYDFYPSACCRIFAEADAVAFDWMDKNLPRNAHILIASSEMVVFESNPLVSQAGSDAGIWLTPLINRETFSMSYLTDFNQSSTQSVLRHRDITYIYIGGTAQSFPEAQLHNNPSFYKLVFSLPGAHLYQVLNTP